jgi:hypothetical protein
MKTLKSYSIASLSANKVRLVDLQLGLSLGEKYAKHLADFVNTHFEYVDFTCSDNGISKELRLLMQNDYCATLHIDIDAFKNNTIIITSNNIHFEDNYTSFEQFMLALQNIGKQLCEQK